MSLGPRSLCSDVRGSSPNAPVGATVTVSALVSNESSRVDFAFGPDDPTLYGPDMKLTTEAVEFHAWIGGSSDANQRAEFTLVET